MWQLAGIAFATFVAGSARYSAIYSSFAILILFLIWLFVSWLIVLVGAQVAYYHQHPSAYLTQFRWKQNTPAFRERLALMTLVQITRRYLSGEPPFRVPDLAMVMEVPLSVLEVMVEDFMKHGVVYRTAVPKGITLGRPPEQVTVMEIVELVRHKDYPASEPHRDASDPVGTVLRHRDQAVEAALNGLTLKMLTTGEGTQLFTLESTPLELGQPVP